jgi:diguanylate cyclase (GGDEF)-like protein/PAS domain S-box-containing protein
MKKYKDHLLEQLELDVNIGYIVLDNDYKILDVNSYILRSTKFNKSELIGSSINSLVYTHDFHDSFVNIINSRIKNNEPLSFKHEIINAQGGSIWFNISGCIYQNYSIWFAVPIYNENKKEKAIKEIISSIYVKDGLPFMDAITLQISKTLDADHTFIGEIQDSDLSVKTISHSMDKKIVDGFEYNLRDTPCELVHNGKASVFPQDITSLFPKDQVLKDLGIEGYAGIPLFNEKNETLGLIVALYREPIKDPEFVFSTISLFANIVANEYERQKAERAVEEQSVYYQSIIDGIKEPLMVIDKNYNIVLSNKAADKNKVYKYISDKKHPKCYEVSHKRDQPCEGVEHPCPLEVVMDTQERVVLTHEHLDENGKSHFIELTSTPLYDKNSEFIGIIESSRDITEHIDTREQLKEYVDELIYRENYNTLTNLPNRVLFYDRVEQAIRSNKNRKSKLAILFVDIDKFKFINDSFGINIGNDVLKKVAHTLQEHIQDSDTLAHFGADEFAIVHQSVENTNEIIDYVHKILNSFVEPFVFDGNKIYITVSLGVSIYPDDSLVTEELLKYSDVALHKAKENGKNSYEFYRQNLTEAAYERIVLENNLREAVSSDELVDYYQPKVDITTNKIIGLEALIRWQSKDLGLVAPNKFIPLAEELGIISLIDLWMLNTVSKRVSKWYETGHNPGIVSINITFQTFKLENFKDLLLEILQNNKCDPKYLELEITENQIMDDPEFTIELLNNIKSLGIRVSIDDFGTGYSSLSYLKKLPIDTLKIDKMFIDEVANNEQDAAISKTIITLAKTLKLDIVAEGVEYKEQKEFLSKNGCNVVQGYFYYKPMDIEETSKLI